MEKTEIVQLIKETIAESQKSNRFSVGNVTYHTHNNLDSPPIAYTTLVGAPRFFTAVANTNGTTNVNVFGTGGAPFPMTVVGVYLISKDATAGNITLLRRSDTVCTIAKGVVAGVMVGATSISNATYRAGDLCQVDSSTAGNATVFITFVV